MQPHLLNSYIYKKAVRSHTMLRKLNKAAQHDRSTANLTYWEPISCGDQTQAH